MGDIDGTGGSAQILRDTPIRKVVFFEVLGFSGERAAMGVARLGTYLDSPPVSDSLLTPALSPHAPYSTSAEIYRQCVMSGLSVCTHIAETEEELEFLSERYGCVRRLSGSIWYFDSWVEPPATNTCAVYGNVGNLAEEFGLSPLQLPD